MVILPHHIKAATPANVMGPSESSVCARTHIYLFDPLAWALDFDSLVAVLLTLSRMTELLTAMPTLQLHARA